MVLRGAKQTGLPFSYEDYLTLVDTTGRCIRQDKRGAIPQNLPPILERVNIDADTWLYHVTRFEDCYQRAFAKQKALTDTG